MIRLLCKIPLIWSCLVLPGAWAQQPAAAIASVAPAEESVTITDDVRARMTVPVRLNGAQIHQFIVDTGADRTVISTEVAQALNLVAAKPVKLHSMNGASMVPTVILPALDVASTRLTNIRAPALAARHLGADGVLGIDSLKNKRILIDFRTSEMSIADSAAIEVKDESDVIVVVAKSRFGQLILVDADINGRKIQVVLDTGAENSVGNMALRRLTQNQSSKNPPIPISLQGVTGDLTNADYTQVNNIRIGGFNILNAPIAYAEAHPFKRFGLTRKPALLLGMDVLRQFDRISIDFTNRKIKFLLQRSSRFKRTHF
jgi:predicted aspartyl protease